MKVAIAFWGLTRSLKYTILSIYENILNILKKANIEYDIFIHTYNVFDKYTNNRASEKNINLNCNEYLLLNPLRHIIDNQDIIINKLKLQKYYSQPDPWSTNYQTVNNFILAMYSKLKVTELIENEKKSYDYILFLRPDVRYLNRFDLNYFDYINDYTVCIPDFHLFSNFNDRFYLSTFKNGLLYGKLFYNMYKYSIKNKLHSETFHNYYIRIIYKFIILNIPIYFNRVRANGLELNDVDTLLMKKYNLSNENNEIKKNDILDVIKDDFSIINNVVNNSNIKITVIDNIINDFNTISLFKNEK